MGIIRRQLSLFVPAVAGVAIETVRQIVDPVQAGLIGAHVTLCRGDELEPFDVIREKLTALEFAPLELDFGRARRVGGHGLIMDCIAGIARFCELREIVLGTSKIARQEPHLTLAHPRNRRAEGNRLEDTAGLPEALRFQFPTICLIEQIGDAPWVVLERFELRANA